MKANWNSFMKNIPGNCLCMLYFLILIFAEGYVHTLFVIIAGYFKIVCWLKVWFFLARYKCRLVCITPVVLNLCCTADKQHIKVLCCWFDKIILKHLSLLFAFLPPTPVLPILFFTSFLYILSNPLKSLCSLPYSHLSQFILRFAFRTSFGVGILLSDMIFWHIDPGWSLGALGKHGDMGASWHGEEQCDFSWSTCWHLT